MKKNLTNESSCFHTVKKALLYMKLTLVFLMMGFLHVSAKVNGQTMVSLKLNHVEISKGFEGILKIRAITVSCTTII